MRRLATTKEGFLPLFVHAPHTEWQKYGPESTILSFVTPHFSPTKHCCCLVATKQLKGAPIHPLNTHTSPNGVGEDASVAAVVGNIVMPEECCQRTVSSCCREEVLAVIKGGGVAGKK